MKLSRIAVFQAFHALWSFRFPERLSTMRVFKILLLLLVLGAIGAIASWFWVTGKPLTMKSERISFTVTSGSGLKAAAQTIQNAGVEFPAWQLAWMGRILGRSAKIKAGSYEIERGLTALGLLDVLTRGDVSRTEVVLVEGKTFRQFRQVLNQNPDIRHDTQGMSDADILKRLNAKESHPEGLFFPDTYLVDKGSSDFDVMRRAYTAMQTRLADAWNARDPSIPLSSPYDMLILASIVEKETGLAADRGLVAAVFINRLRIKMPLQTDPTVIYGLGERFDGNLRKIDLQTDTPWNTYTRGGLPPTPIAMPGTASLQVVGHPPKNEYLYFVARGDGSSQFSSSLDEHNRAVNRYQRGGKS